MRLLVALLLSTTICACAVQLPKETYIMVYQVDCKGKFTHTYWYHGKVSKSLLDWDRGFVSAKEDIDKYFGVDLNIDTLPSLGVLPWGRYSVWIDGYCLMGESMKDCVVVMPNRMDELP